MKNKKKWSNPKLYTQEEILEKINSKEVEVTRS